tara:strand:+ start:262 stop:885 length:624 start_codon:yes stop_codon:yes gene_type:complete
VQQNQDIKGFTILELLVVVVIVVVISAVSYPRFNSWKADRELNQTAVNVVSMLNGIVSQSKRGSFPFVQFIATTSDEGGETSFETKGMSQSTFVRQRADILNSNDCTKSARVWDKDKVHFINKEIKVNFVGSGSVCFSKDSSIYKSDSKLNGNFIILCNKNITGKFCTTDENLLEKPAYKIEWNRFGSITKKKWNKKDGEKGTWTLQ